jgi:hypothetical protein
MSKWCVGGQRLREREFQHHLAGLVGHHQDGGKQPVLVGRGRMQTTGSAMPRYFFNTQIGEDVITDLNGEEPPRDRPAGGPVPISQTQK